MIVSICLNLPVMDNKIHSRSPQPPTIFSHALHNDLKELSFRRGSTLIQYVDDLLLASPSASACETNTVVLLKALAVKGHKSSLKKVQLCQNVVQYFGHT